MGTTAPAHPVAEWLGLTLSEIWPTIFAPLDWDVLEEVQAVLSEHPAKPL